MHAWRKVLPGGRCTGGLPRDGYTGVGYTRGRDGIPGGVSIPGGVPEECGGYTRGVRVGVLGGVGTDTRSHVWRVGIQIG